jgi:hypothetical protein
MVSSKRLFSSKAEPARDATLRLGRLPLDGTVKVINLLQSLGLGLLCFGLDFALDPGSLALGVGDLQEGCVS